MWAWNALFFEFWKDFQTSVKNKKKARCIVSDTEDKKPITLLVISASVVTKYDKELSKVTLTKTMYPANIYLVIGTLKKGVKHVLS